MNRVSLLSIRFLFLVPLLLFPRIAPAQDWIVDLAIDPYPSPYISDWESDPSIGWAAITNNTGNPAEIRLYLTLTNNWLGRIGEAHSAPLTVLPGSMDIYAISEVVDWEKLDYEGNLSEQVIRTGRLPEGEYTACVRLRDLGGGWLTEEVCVTFTIVFPDPPELLSPFDGEPVRDESPIFQWTPVLVPPDYAIHYVWRIVEILEGQAPYQALAANRPHHEANDLLSPHLQYPIDALALQPGKTYAWQVQVLDRTGYPPTVRDGKSEVWVFPYQPEEESILEQQPAGWGRRLAGVLRDRVTGKPVAGVTVHCETENATGWPDKAGAEGSSSPPGETVTGYDGSFEFQGVPDSSWARLRAAQSAKYSGGQDQGPFFQVGDVDNLILYLSPRGCAIRGFLKTRIGGKVAAVSNVLVHLSQANQEDQGWSVYTGRDGFFEFPEVHAKFATPSPAFLIRVRADRYEPYVSARPIPFKAGATINTKDHFLVAQTGTIAGRISNAGTPVEGATVALYAGSIPALPAGAAFSRGDITQCKPGGPKARWSEEDAGRPTGEPILARRTDHNGNYVLPDVLINDPRQVMDRYVLWTKSDAHAPAAQSVRLERAGETVTIDCTLAVRQGFVFGQVRDSSGVGIGHVLVELRDGADPSGSPVAAVETDSDGHYTLVDIAAGKYQLLFTKEGYQPTTPEKLAIGDGLRIERNPVLGRARCVLSVTVRDPAGAGIPLAGLAVREMPSLFGTAFTDHEGRYTNAETICGTLHLLVRAPLLGNRDTTVVMIPGDTTHVAVRFSAPKCRLVVTVIDSVTRAPLAGMDVTLEGHGTARTDSRGQAVIALAPVGTSVLTVTPPGSPTYPQDYVGVVMPVTLSAWGFEQLIQIQLKPGARISGTVVTQGPESPLRGALVSIEGNPGIRDTSGADGEFLLRNVPAGGVVALRAQMAGHESGGVRDIKLAAGDHRENVRVSLPKAAISSLFGFPVVVDSIVTRADGTLNVTGALVNLPNSPGFELVDPQTQLYFANVEVDSDYQPTSTSIQLATSEIEVEVFGVPAVMSRSGGLLLERGKPGGDGTQTPGQAGTPAGRITGQIVVTDQFSRKLPGTKWMPMVIPPEQTPFIRSDGGISCPPKFDLMIEKPQIKPTIQGVPVDVARGGIVLDRTGFHVTGSLVLTWPRTVSLPFDDLWVGKGPDGSLEFKGAKVSPGGGFQLSQGDFTIVDSSFTWNKDGFWLAGQLIFKDPSRDYTWDVKKLHLSPKGVPQSGELAFDEANGTLSVCGQQFALKSIKLGTKNWQADSLSTGIYVDCSGELVSTVWDRPIEFENLKITADGKFDGRLGFNQSRSFRGIVTVMVEGIEFDRDDKGPYVGFPAKISFDGLEGVDAQAGYFRAYSAEEVSLDEKDIGFVAGSVEVQQVVVFDGNAFVGRGSLKNAQLPLTLGAEFRYGGVQDWWIKVVSEAPVPLGLAPIDLVGASGGLGLRDGIWRFQLGGQLVPQTEPMAISLDLLAELRLLSTFPPRAKLLGNASVVVADEQRVGQAAIELIFPSSQGGTTDAELVGSIWLNYDGYTGTPKVPVTVSANLDLGARYSRLPNRSQWFIKGRGQLTFLESITGGADLVLAQNWRWERGDKQRLINGFSMEMDGAGISRNGQDGGLAWEHHLTQQVYCDAPFDGDVDGGVRLAGTTQARIDLPGVFGAVWKSPSIAYAADLQEDKAEWRAHGSADVRLEAKFGPCDAACNRTCSRCGREVVLPGPGDKRTCASPLFGVKVCRQLKAEFDFRQQQQLEVKSTIGF